MKKTISAVHSSDVTAFFSRLGLLDALQSGTLTCHACGTAITAESFRAAGRRGAALLFVCTRQDCVAEFLEGPQESAR